MTEISYKQLAFILDIEPIEALEKMIAANCKIGHKDLPHKREKVREYLADETIPRTMPVDVLASCLNLPDLSTAIEDIRHNYLKRQATKKWILCDYPEKQLVNNPRHKVRIPPVLASMVDIKTLTEIKKVWNERFNIPV
jgi:hypothetical protein